MTIVKVDAMESEEAFCIPEEHFKNVGHQDQVDECRKLIVEITESLDRLALAMDLAGARIRANTEEGNYPKAALCQYLSDYRHNRLRLLQDEQFASVAPYKKKRRGRHGRPVLRRFGNLSGLRQIAVRSICSAS
jgi:hypothetical protein